MNARIHAVVPIKDTSDAKRRLAGVLCAGRRQELALTMFEDVLAALTGVRELAGIVVVTVDPAAATSGVAVNVDELADIVGFDQRNVARQREHGFRRELSCCGRDRADTAAAAELGIPVTQAHTLMTTLADREELARHVLASADAAAKATA